MAREVAGGALQRCRTRALGQQLAAAMAQPQAGAALASAPGVRSAPDLLGPADAARFWAWGIRCPGRLGRWFAQAKIGTQWRITPAGGPR